MSFPFNELKELFEDYLKGIFQPENSLLKKAVNYSLLNPGKRLRPLIVLTGGVYLKSNVKKLLPVAAAVEILHTASLIHDDLPIMDDDNVRRGKPALHKAFSSSIALIAGDYMISKAFSLALEIDYPDEKKIKLLRKLLNVWGEEGLCRGQAEEIELEKGGDVQPYSIIKYKTASLFGFSFSAPFMLSFEGDEIEEDFERLGELLGIIFQINDDKDDINDNSFNLFKFLEKKKVDEIYRNAKDNALLLIEKYDLKNSPYSNIFGYFFREDL